MTIEQTIDRPAALKGESTDSCEPVETFGDNGDICPLCGKPHIPNAETLAAKAECDAIMRGDIPVKRLRPKSNSRKDILASIREAMED